MQIHYEPHPVSPERKAELRAKGLRIVDARFAPKDASPASDLTPEGIEKMSKADVVELLEAHGVDAPTGKVADLRDQLARVMFMGL